ncbi:hypothetical protein SELR_23710 [Selenomonas ruminantium subsp. lactilytica TAM6421]|uniref:WbqC-like protein family protein n=2 Tax=Selenomonas ruminantium TaxID=971 RepID=A0A927WMJ8_SELRU|nr:WbqC family protein [Selenomonas ruminantium]MBE6085503.1 hypothetical protein [Selenomonas ruminantium]BAL84079.1 hypothetical protein SELR_23710 [Selenomonas ruminantium subsp. lactilytica TAM6421]
MKVAMMQPTFLPWLGYFELIMKVDLFVFCDDFQFVRKSYHQRNRLLFGKQNVTDITVPVKKKGVYQQKINEVEIREDLPWRTKLWKSIELNYHKTPYFSAYKDKIEPLIVQPKENLAKQNMELIECISSLIGAKTEFIRSSELHAIGARSELVKNLLHEVHADSFYQAHGSFPYMNEDGVFPLRDIPVYFQDAVPIPYRQYNNSTGQFVPYLSVLDVLFNIGAEDTAKIASCMTEHWLAWTEMLNIHQTYHV